MDGFELVQAIETELKQRKISKAKFYEDTGISSATFSQWRKKIYAPSSAALKKIEQYLGIVLTFEQKEKPTAEIGELTPEQIKAIEKIKKMPPDELARKMPALEAVLDM